MHYVVGVSLSQIELHFFNIVIEVDLKYVLILSFFVLEVIENLLDDGLYVTGIRYDRRDSRCDEQTADLKHESFVAEIGLRNDDVVEVVKDGCVEELTDKYL